MRNSGRQNRRFLFVPAGSIRHFGKVKNTQYPFAPVLFQQDVMLARHIRGREGHGRSRYVGYFRLYIGGTGYGP